MHIDPTQLNPSIGKRVTVGGFVHTIRDHGGLIFIDLRSQLDILQCVISSQTESELFKKTEMVKSEYVLKVSGLIQKRSIETINAELPTGSIELIIEDLEIVSKAKTLPFDIHAEDSKLANEDVRLKYRYLDLRREKLKKLLTKKHKLILATRNWFDSKDFIEIQTPILANSSPEGARDFLVPSRIHSGKFYALPQAPQQFKQLLMVGGFNKYFQIAPCFRDEDPRSDRHPGDFYQIDAEIAWADQEYILDLNERFAREVLSKFSDKKIPKDSFTRISYFEAMNKYGSDKPDLRFGLPWQDAKLVFKNSGFKVFADLCEQKYGKVQALVVKNAVDKFSRSDLDKLQDIGRQHGLPGIAYIQYFEEGAKSPIFKFLGDTNEAIEIKKAEIKKHFNLETGDLVLFIANADQNIVYKTQNQIRLHICKHLDLIDHSILKFVWVTDFPFFEFDEKTGKLDFNHNPFSLWKSDEGKTPIETLENAIKNNTILDLTAIQYDLTLNGYEVISGGVRNPNPEALLKVFKLVGYSEEEVRNRFKHMMEAYEYAAPPHAGFAWGLDRLFMVLSEEENIREVIAFPKNGSGMDVMTNSPSEVDPKLLKELGIKVME